MREETRRLRSRVLNGFEMLPEVHQPGDLFTVDMDSARIMDWQAPVEWFAPTPPPDGTPIVRSSDGAVWVLTKQANIFWVDVLKPRAMVLPLALFDGGDDGDVLLGSPERGRASHPQLESRQPNGSGESEG